MPKTPNPTAMRWDDEDWTIPEFAMSPDDSKKTADRLPGASPRRDAPPAYEPVKNAGGLGLRPPGQKKAGPIRFAGDRIDYNPPKDAVQYDPPDGYDTRNDGSAHAATAGGRLHFAHANQTGISQQLYGTLTSTGADLGIDLDLTSGYRSPDHPVEKAKKNGGGEHTHGDAADINMAGMSDSQRAQLVQTLLKNGGKRFITYSSSPDMLHVDLKDQNGDGSPWFMFDKSNSNMGRAPQWFREVYQSAGKSSGVDLQVQSGTIDGPTGGIASLPDVPYLDAFVSASQKYGVPVNVLMGLAQQESGFDPRALGQPTKWGRARGIMQYLPSTAASMGINPYDPYQSIDAAAKQFRNRLDKGYSVREAVNAHFAGDDRNLWGPKTARYGDEVLGRAERFAGGVSNGGSYPADSPRQDLPDQTRQDLIDGLNWQREMGLPDSTAFQTSGPYDGREEQINALLDKLNATNGSELRMLTPDELARLDAQGDDAPEIVEPEEINISIPNLTQASVSAYEPTLWERFTGLFPGNKDAATVEAFAREEARKTGQSVDEVYRSMGGRRPLLNPEGRPPIQALTEGAQVVAEQFPRVPGAIENATLRAVRGGDVPAEDKTWLDRRITATDPKDAYIDPNYQSLAGLDQSLGFSVANLLPSLLAGALGSAASPAAGTAAGAATSAGIAYRSSKDQFLSQVRDKAESDKGGKLTTREWEDIRIASEGAAMRYGAWEAIPEAIGNGIAFKMISSPLKGGTRIMRAADAARRMGLEQATEQATETATNVGQSHAEVDVGLSDHPLSPEEAWRQQAVQTVVVSGITGGAGQAGRAAYDGITGAGREQSRTGEQQGAAPESAASVLPSDGAPENPNAGPLERAVTKGAPPAAQTTGAARQSSDTGFLGPVGTKTRVVPAEDPNFAFEGTIEKYVGDEVYVRDHEGTPYQFGRNDVVQHAPAPEPVAAPDAFERTLAGGLDADLNGTTPAPGGIAEKAKAASQKPEEIKPTNVDVYAGMTEPQLRERLKYLAGQAKRAGGWNKRLVEERRKIEKAIQAIPGKPEALASESNIAAPSVDEAAGEAATSPENDLPEPSEAQHEAGNYKMGHVNLNGLDVTIEIPAGGKRRGRDKDGKTWEREVNHHYGYIKRTTGADGENVDVYLGPNAEDAANPIYVVDQKSPDGRRFDEHKAMIGFRNATAARTAFKANFPSDFKTFGGITKMSQEAFRDWLANGDMKAPLRKRAARPDQDVARSATTAAKPTPTGTVKGPLTAEPAEPAPEGAAISSRPANDRWDNAGPNERAQLAKKAGLSPGLAKKDFGDIAEKGRARLIDAMNAEPHATNEATPGAASSQTSGQQEAGQGRFTKARDALKEHKFKKGDRVEFVVPGPFRLPGGKIVQAHIEHGTVNRIISRNQGMVEVKRDGGGAITVHADEAGHLSPEQEDNAPGANDQSDTEASDRWGRASAKERAQLARKAGLSQGLAKKDFADIADKGRTRLIAVMGEEPKLAPVEKPRRDAASVGADRGEGLGDPGSENETTAERAEGVTANTIFTEDAAEKARATLRRKLSQLNSGIDPEIMQAGITLAGYHIEKGARTFAAYARAMVADMGDSVKPYLKSWYMGVKYDPRASNFDGMSSATEVETANVDALSKALDRVDDETQTANSSTQEEKDADNGREPAPTDHREGDQGPAAGTPPEPDGGRTGSDSGRTDGSIERDLRTASKRGDEPDFAHRQPVLSARSEQADTGIDDRRPGSEPDGAGAGNRANRRPLGDYRYAPGELKRDRSRKRVAERNVEIVERIKTLRDENRMATPEERSLLARYAGWGAGEIANGIFPNPKTGLYKDGWQELGERLKAALTPDEYAAARRTTQYAHYTSESVIRSIYAGLNRMGFAGGRVLEPGMGIGLFKGLMPDAMAARTQYVGIEYDPLTAAIAKHLYPESSIREGDYAKSDLPRDFFDAAIGNPPFGQTRITNDPEYRKQAFLLHDYFFAKTIDRVRPGGLVVFVTSKGTMDKGNSSARRYLADRANLVGAVRLPQTAFKDNAGTEVVTDVLFLQKRGEGIEPNGVEWMKTVDVKTAQGPTPVNEYFAANPEMVLGTHALTGSMYRKDSYTVTPRDGDIEAHFDAALQKLPTGIFRATRGSAAEQATVVEHDFNPTAKKEGSVYLNDKGDLYQVSQGVGTPLTTRTNAAGKTIPLNKREMAFLTDYVGLLGALKHAQYDQLHDGDWEASLASLNDAYNAFVAAHGNILANTITEREKADGTVSVAMRFKNNIVLNLDAENALIRSLEEVKPDGTILKGKLLQGRTLNKPTTPKINSVQDALLVSMNQIGRMDMAEVSRLSGKSEQEIISTLGDAVYNDPSSGWVTADAYLSGDVVRKLKQARAAARLDPKLKRNVEALEAVQPAPLAPTDITVQLGSHWVPASDVSAFAGAALKHTFDVTYNPITRLWGVNGEVVSGSEWSIEKMSAPDILEAVLNNRTIRITSRVSDGKGGTTTVPDAEMTEAANAIAKKMDREFRRWIWSDGERSERLAAYYNDHFNNIVPRSFNGDHLTLPGISSRFNLYSHQKRTVWRGIQDGNLYIAHAVGAGKTYEMIALGMEERRLGLSRKPMYAVPNHMLAQFAREFQELYPTAHVMVADEENFHTSNRQQFVARAALNDPDAIIITHSAFGRIRMSDDFNDSYVQDQIDAYQEIKDEVDTSDRTTVKRLEAMIERLERRLTGNLDLDRKDNVLTFEELGVDRLFVDEFHEFRKLDFATNRGAIKGIDPNGSQRAMDLHMKVQYLETINPGRALVAASGTPVTNTMGELYTVQRFMQPRQLEEDGLDSFDAWASQFGEVVEALEPTPAGNYEPVSRFANFVNVPDLMRRVRSFMDILTSDQLGDLVQRPAVAGGGRKVTVTPVPDGYKAYQQQLDSRIKAIRNRKGPPKPGDDIILSVISDGRFSAIDMRFVDPTRPSDPNSKLNTIIEKLARKYHETKDWQYGAAGKPDDLPGASLMLFTDIGLGAQSAANRGFDMRDWIVRELIARGVKPEHLAFMRDYKQHAKKERLFADMRAGKKRILIGGKDMETGVNAQKRLAYLGHLDAPWFPASVEQREGRGIRQGNQNKEIEIEAFATKGSYDSTMWGMNARKQRFITQALQGNDSVRRMEDVSEASSFEMAAALASGDPRYLKLAGLRADVDRLKRLWSAHERGQRDLRSDMQHATATAAYAIKNQKEVEEAIGRRGAIPDPFIGEVNGTAVEGREDFSNAIFAAFHDLASSGQTGSVKIGNVAGIDITFTGENLRGGIGFVAAAEMELPGDGAPLAVWPIDPEASIKGIAQRALNQINRLDKSLADFKRMEEQNAQKVEQLSRRLGAAFPEQAELAEKQEQLQALEDELALENENDQIEPQADAPDDARNSVGEEREPVANLTGDELGPWTNMRDLGRKAEIWYRKNLVEDGGMVTNGETGWEIRFDRRGARKIGGRKGEDLYRMIPALPAILEKGHLISSQADKRGRPDLKAFHVFAATVGLEGVYHDVVVTVRETANGNFHYDLSKDWKSGASTPASNETRNADGADTNKASTQSGLEGDPAIDNIGENPENRNRNDSDRQSVGAADLNLDFADPTATSAAPIRDALTSGRTGPTVSGLIEAGRIVLHDHAPSDQLATAAGWMDGSGIVHLNTSRLSTRTALPVLMHEMFHAGSRSLKGTKRWKNLMARLDTYVRAAERRAREDKPARHDWDRAYQRIRRAQDAGDSMGGNDAARVAEEMGAYAVENVAAMPAGIRQWAETIIGMVKDFMFRRLGIQVGEITPAQLHAFAAAALRNQSSRADNGFEAGRGAPARMEPENRSEPDGADDWTVQALAELAAVDELFQNPKATGKRTLKGVFEAIDPTVRFIGDMERSDEEEASGAEQRFLLRTAKGRDFYIFQTPDDVWTDISQLHEGGSGARIYQAIAEYAFNTDRTFIGDPAGLTDIALRRRNEAMLSSALKHGTTQHLEPHERQLKGEKAIGVPPLHWKNGDDLGNIRSLIDVSLGSIKSKFPEIDDARYDFETRTFRDSEGEPLSDEVLARWASSLRGVREARAGSATLKRSILLNTLSRQSGGERSRSLEQIIRQPRQLVTKGGLKGTFYSVPNMERDPNPPTAEDDVNTIKSWWTSTAQWGSDRLTQTMPKLLATVPMRPLVTELGTEMPSAGDYMTLKQAMDAMRSEWHAKTDKVAQRWLKYRTLHASENRDLMGIMHDSTRMQVDPSEAFQRIFTEKDREKFHESPVGSSERERLSKKAAHDRTRRNDYAELKKQWDKLSPEAKALYVLIRDTYSEIADAYEKVLLGNMEKAINIRIKKAERAFRRDMEGITDQGLTGKEKEDAVKAARDKLAAAKTRTAWNRAARITQMREQFETNRLNGPYFPLARFGNFFVTVRDNDSGEVVSFSRFESVGAQRRFANSMRRKPEYSVEVGALDDSASLRKAVDPGFVSDIEDILADLPFAERAKDEVWQRYLETLPDMSIRKNRIHRKGRSGYDADALRAFAHQMFHGSHQLARLAHSFEMEDALDKMSDEARRAKDPTRAGLVANEINKRHEFIMNPTGSSAVQTITSAAFTYYLAVSPAAAMVNLSQTVIIGVPVLAAYHGGAKGFARAGAQLMGALQDFTLGGGQAERSRRLTEDEKRAMDAGYRTGIIDRTQSHDLAGIGETGVEYRPGRAKVMAAISWAFHHAERLNREVTFLAAYRIARQKGLDHEGAVLKAGDLTWKTHFDYQNTSRPRLMHSDTAKALLVFRNYNVNMLYRLFRDTHQALHGESKEIRREAFTQLSGITAMMMANAGIKGTWMFGIAMVLAGFFLDDGDDPEQALKKAMVEAVGPMMAGLAMDGIPGYLTDTSLSGRVGMPDLWFRSPDRQLEGEDSYNYWLGQVVGAAPGIVENMLRGIRMIKEGKTYRGVETIAPTFITNLMRAYRYQTEGATTFRGDLLLEHVTPWEIFVQALGFTPAALAERYEINNANMNRQKAIMGKRTKLLDQYFQAIQDGNDKQIDRVIEDMRAFSEKYPEQAIAGKTVRRSIRTKQRNTSRAEGGMLYNRKLQQRILENQAPTIYR